MVEEIWGCQNLDQAMSGRPETKDSIAVLQSEANQVSSILRVSGELRISQSSVVRQVYDLSKYIQICRNENYIIKNIAKLFTQPRNIVIYLA